MSPNYWSEKFHLAIVLIWILNLTSATYVWLYTLTKSQHSSVGYLGEVSIIIVITWHLRTSSKLDDLCQSRAHIERSRAVKESPF